jgi:hypothetical protein|tara:strand:+ start:1869 stop:2033 length:165 start_codon:yes stop_codon:yes gene_type:complete
MAIKRKDSQTKYLYRGNKFILQWEDSYSMDEDVFTGEVTNKKLLRAGLVLRRNV